MVRKSCSCSGAYRVLAFRWSRMWCTVTLRGTFHSGAMVNDVTRLFKVGVGPVRPSNDNALAEPHLAPAHYLQGVGR